MEATKLEHTRHVPHPRVFSHAHLFEKLGLKRV